METLRFIKFRIFAAVDAAVLPALVLILAVLIVKVIR